MTSATDLFGCDKALVGMVHVRALPGTPRNCDDMETITATAAGEAALLADAGFDAILVENMHDVPYLRRRVGPEIVAGMAMATRAVRQAVELPVGVQILAGANAEALAVAQATGAGFVRVEGFVFASVADEGLMADADAGPLLRYRRSIGAEHVRIIADVKKKHSSHALTGDVDLAEMSRAAAFFGADGIIVTGTATGDPVRLDDLDAARASTTVPLIVGSGATPQSAGDLLARADAIIVGSAVKRDGLWSNPIDEERARAMVAAVDAAR